MLAFVLVAQLAATSSPAARPGDDTYSSPALRAVVAAAANANRVPPPQLHGYRANIETEFSFIMADSLGRERIGEIEQLAATTRWNVASGEYGIHVAGYRVENVGLPYSALTLVNAWTVPSLYGERFWIGTGVTRDSSARQRDSTRRTLAVHPLATDRDSYYRFSGGDTITVLRTGERSIPIVRIRVTPRVAANRRLAVLDGELDLDATRHQIVRLRGMFVQTTVPGTLRSVGYAEYVNAEVDGQFWLPAFQRAEFQSAFSVLAQTRFVFRMLTRFSDYDVDAAPDRERSSTGRTRLVLTYAPTDSLSRYGAWRNQLGATTASVGSNDFADVAPDAWRAVGPPRARYFPRSTPDVLRFNRIEGLFLGFAPSIDFRDRAPGVSAGVFGGYAFSERTMRGGAAASWSRAPWSVAARAERALVSTNDFSPTLTGDAAIGALLGAGDWHDYVDRRTAHLSVTRMLGATNTAMVTFRAGPGRDRAETARLTRGILGGTAYEPNRPAANGGYWLGAAELELNPAVTGMSVEPGFGARLRYEVGEGQLAWQRVELGLAARRAFGAVSVGTVVDGGVVIATQFPPQVLFELGGESQLPGFTYKQFTGDRAAISRMYATYRLPLFSSPLRLGGLVLPGLAPALYASAQSGWTELSSPQARLAAATFGPDEGASGGVRTSVWAGVTAFGGVAQFGFTREVDRPAPWRFQFRFGG